MSFSSKANAVPDLRLKQQKPPLCGQFAKKSPDLHFISPMHCRRLQKVQFFRLFLNVNISAQGAENILEVIFLKLDKKEYEKLYKGISPPSPSYRNIPMAFLVGGGLCALAQGFFNLYTKWGLSEKDVPTAVSMTVVFIGVALTAAGIFDNIARRAGAGTLVPITGFANSIAAPALEFKSEGFIMGTCVKMFSIAGPVLVFGISASVIYGLILYALGVAA